jgi:hypothetical protein
MFGFDFDQAQPFGAIQIETTIGFSSSLPACAPLTSALGPCYRQVSRVVLCEGDRDPPLGFAMAAAVRF